MSHSAQPAPSWVPHTPSLATRLGWVAALPLFTAAMWSAWLGWDHEYYLVDGVAQGPYRSWQVVGCGLAIIAGTVLVRLRLRGRLPALVLPLAATVGVAVPWGLQASADESGLWVVGLGMLLVGGTLGLLVVQLVADAVGRQRAARRTDPGA